MARRSEWLLQEVFDVLCTIGAVLAAGRIPKRPFLWPARCRKSFADLGPFCAFAQSHKEDRTLSFSVGREEGHYIIVVEGEPARAQVQCVGSEIELPTDDPRFQLHGSVSPAAEALKDCIEVGKKEYCDAGVGGKFLIQTEIPASLRKSPSLSSSNPRRSRLKKYAPEGRPSTALTIRYRSLTCAPKRLRKSAGTPRVERSRIVESSTKLMGSRANRRVEPRRRITCSVESGGSAVSPRGFRWRSSPTARTGLTTRVLPRQSATSSGVSSEEAACIIRMAG